MPLLGTAAMLLSFDLVPEAVDDHDRWHTQEHLPERMSIPGFLRGTRWIATEGGPRCMVLYEVDRLETLSGGAYLARLNDPTPWTRRVMPHYRGMRRGLCAVAGSFGFGQGGFAALVRFDRGPGDRPGTVRWLLDEVLPDVPRSPGLGSAHLLQGTSPAEMTEEQRLRGADLGLDSAIVVTGYDPGAVAGLARRLCAADGLPARGAREVGSATYSLAYSLACSELAD